MCDRVCHTPGQESLWVLPSDQVAPLPHKSEGPPSFSGVDDPLV